MSTYTSTILQRFYAQARELEPRPGEVARVLERVSQAQPLPRRRPSHSVVVFVGVTLLAAALGIGAAFPSIVGEAFGSLSSFFGGGSAPGQPVGSDNLPSWFDKLNAVPGSARILVSSDEENLYAYRSLSVDDYNAECFSFGGYTSMCSSVKPKVSLLANLELSPIYLVGPTPPDRDGRESLWGLARSDVAQIELTYKVGRPRWATLDNNAFILRADPSRIPEELIVRDAQGKVLLTVDAAEATGRVAGIGWSFVMKKHGCVAVNTSSNDVYSTNAPGCP